MTIEKVCEKCGEINLLDFETIKKERVYDEFETPFLIMYYKCKRCGTIAVLQIDSTETERLAVRLKTLVLTVISKRNKKLKVSQKDKRKKDVWSKQLQEKRQLLQERMKGKKLFKENKEIFIDCLTFGKESVII